MPRIWFTVTTPVPPIPIMKMLASSGTLNGGAGNGWSTMKTRRSFFRALRGTTVRNDGQSPCRHE